MIKNISQISMRFPWIRSRVRVVLILTILCWGVTVPAFAENNESAIWDALKSGGHVVLIRHAIAPGTGDPPEFQLGKCTTQRNLSDEGRDQAEKIGARFRENGIHRAWIFSSQWCRCLETAKLLRLGKIEELAVLNSFFEHMERRDSQTKMLLEWLGERDLKIPLVLVTHQVNITALTGIYPGSGEMVVVRLSNAGDITVVGTIETP